MNINNARKFLEDAGVFYYPDKDDPKSAQTLNMNDTWGWACAWGEYVEDEQLPELAALFCRYGHGGLLYWVSEKNDKMRSEFHDVNRAVDFVRREENFRKKVPSSSARAYKRLIYVLGLG